MIISFRISWLFLVLTEFPFCELFAKWGPTTALAGSIALGFPTDYSVVINEIHYDPDVSPWPDTADGKGYTLQRISADQYHSGNDPDNWGAVPPTPGGNP